MENIPLASCKTSPEVSSMSVRLTLIQSWLAHWQVSFQWLLSFFSWNTLLFPNVSMVFLPERFDTFSSSSLWTCQRLQNQPKSRTHRNWRCKHHRVRLWRLPRNRLVLPLRPPLQKRRPNPSCGYRHSHRRHRRRSPRYASSAAEDLSISSMPACSCARIKVASC